MWRKVFTNRSNFSGEVCCLSLCCLRKFRIAYRVAFALTVLPTVEPHVKRGVSTKNLYFCVWYRAKDTLCSRAATRDKLHHLLTERNRSSQSGGGGDGTRWKDIRLKAERPKSNAEAGAHLARPRTQQQRAKGGERRNLYFLAPFRHFRLM